MRDRLILVIGMLFFSFLAYGQGNQNEKQVFEHAKKLYASGRYDSTSALLMEYVKLHGKEPSMEYIVPLLMESLIRQNDSVYFKKLFKIYFQMYSESQYIARVLYLKGIVEGREKDYVKSVVSFSDAMKKGLTTELDTLAQANVRKICETALPSSKLELLANDQNLHPKINEIATFYAISAYTAENQNARAKKLSDDFKRKYPDSPLNSGVKKFAAKTKTQMKNTVQIGVLAPLSGEQADIGKSIVQSVQIAVDIYNKNGSPRVELVTLDTRTSNIETARKMYELQNVLKIPVCIGPMISSDAIIAASAIMGRDECTMITPTATDDGIASLGNNIFQLNTTPGVLGRNIAQYATKNLHIKEYAILSPMTPYGRSISARFKEEVKREGGVIVAEDLFEPEINDFRAQFENIRRQIAQYVWEKTSVSGAIVPKTPKEKMAFMTDSLVEIGGFFIPAEPEDIVKIAPQVSFYQIRTQLLGATGWHTPSIIQDGKKYVENAIFSANFEVEPQNERWVAFAQLYKNTYKEQPDNITAPLGYDAANLILNAIGQGSQTAKEIADNLRMTRGYQGLSGLVSFDVPEGVNTECAIYKISNKKFVKVQ